MQTKATHAVTLPVNGAEPGWEIRTDTMLDHGCVYTGQRHFKNMVGYPTAVSAAGEDGYRFEFSSCKTPEADAFFSATAQMHYRVCFDFKLDHKAKIVWLTDLCLCDGAPQPGEQMYAVQRL